MKISVENCYSDGHESTIEYDVDEFDFDKHHDEDDWGPLDPNNPADYREAVDHYLQQWTGDGHGIGNRATSFHEVTILESTNPDLVNQMFEYDG